MTEAEWLGCDDPTPMLEWLQRSSKASERKMRMFLCACCRRIWDLIPVGPCRKAVETVEAYADGLATENRLHRADREVGSILAETRSESWSSVDHWLTHETASAVHGTTKYYHVHLSSYAEYVTGPVLKVKARTGGDEERERVVQAALLRDIFGDPFRSTPRIDPTWLTWSDGAVRRLSGWSGLSLMSR